MARRIAEEVLAIDAGQPVANVQTLEEVRGEALAQPAAHHHAAPAVRLLALVHHRRRPRRRGGLLREPADPGDRGAHGARRRARRGAGDGAARGTAPRRASGWCSAPLAAVLLTRLMTGLLFHVEATDPIAFGGMAAGPGADRRGGLPGARPAGHDGGSPGGSPSLLTRRPAGPAREGVSGLTDAPPVRGPSSLLSPPPSAPLCRQRPGESYSRSRLASSGSERR